MSFFKKLFGKKEEEPKGSERDAVVPKKEEVAPPPPVDVSQADQSVDCSGVDWNESAQLEFLAEILPERLNEDFLGLMRSEEFSGNPECLPVDAAIIYAMMAHYEPGRLMEVGAGYTTLVFRLAKEIEMLPGELISVDPEPRIDISEEVDAHIALPVQELPIDDFTIMQAGEMLFIDSTHVYRPGGEIAYILEKVFPALPSGLILGFQGIRLPRNYTREELERNFNEQEELLKAITKTREVELLFAGNWLAINHSENWKKVFPEDWQDQNPTCFWFRLN